jgi:hypothetical protein
MQRFISFLAGILIFISTGYTQTNIELERQINVLFGIGQIASGGFNIEGNYAPARLIFDYSHGVNLTTTNAQLEDGADKEQGLAVHIPWTTGFGVGYRFNNWLNLRVEPKWHKYEIYYDGEDFNTTNQIVDYTTFTLGLGLYANLKPFKNQTNFLKGIMVVPNARWWPNVATSLPDNKHSYFNTQTGQIATHEARNIGIANTPYFVNISIGYSFGN